MRSSPPDNSESSARACLRLATADLHAAVEARFAPLLTQGEAGYSEFLVSSAAAVLPVETALTDANIAGILPDWPLRSRSEVLRHDLADLSLPEPATLPVPEVHARAFQLGMVYVLEGSRLGARLVLRQVLAAASPLTRTATRYLSHGQHLPLWPAFLHYLEASHLARHNPEEVIAGARAMYRHFLTGTCVSTQRPGGVFGRG